MPWTFPEGEDSGVFMSPCASSHKQPIFFDCLRKKSDTPEHVPMAMEWSPPSTKGKNPSASVFSVISAKPPQVSAISCKYLARFSP